MSDLYLGLDVGTSGVRTIIIDDNGATISESRSSMREHGSNLRDPAVWRAATVESVKRGLDGIESKKIRALAVDGTSGTVIATDGECKPCCNALMYNDSCKDIALMELISELAPKSSAAVGGNSALARAIALDRDGAAMVLHQADWISHMFSGRVVSDENNALKTGYDLKQRKWPDWIGNAGMDVKKLPEVVEPGVATGTVGVMAAHEFGFDENALVVAGTTDGCAGFLATGAASSGDGVTSLGTTLTVKLLSENEISAPRYGIYSHRLFNKWLAGGASNTGGGVLLKYFTPETLDSLSLKIDPEVDSALDYYPLSKAGERFPVNDRDYMPRLSPRPDDDAEFLKGMFDGMARIEARAYDLMQRLGAPSLRSIRTVGGGARNGVWERIRAKRLGMEMLKPVNEEAAYGAALIARHGAKC
ncbi:MAG: FGGY-family carbohydrate kinase [Roseovarius sp.]|nr:FGGY-family carbohydrate kinase [Roseovarius sp.]